MFQFSAFAPLRVTGLQPAGFPHSEMYGSTDICSSPYLIAAYHVLLRLSKPRHSPCALSNLSNSWVNSFCLLLQSIPICQWTLLLLQVTLWRITESNRWPPACKAGALASWANPPVTVNREWRTFCSLLIFIKTRFRSVILVVPSRFELLTPTLSV